MNGLGVGRVVQWTAGAVSLLCAPAVLAQSISVNGPVAPVNVTEAPEYSTAVLGRAWDMDAAEDFPLTVNFGTPAVADGQWSGTVAASPAYLYPLTPGRATTNVDASTYSKMSVRVSLQQDDRAYFYVGWSASEQAAAPGVGSSLGWADDENPLNWEGIPSADGYRIYDIDLTGAEFLNDHPQVVDGGFFDAVQKSGEWSGTVSSLYLMPTSAAADGTQMAFDWVRLYDPDTSTSQQITWSADTTGLANPFVRVYVDTDDSGQDGDLFMSGLQADGSFELPLGALPPGTYYVYLQLCERRQNSITVEATSGYTAAITVAARSVSTDIALTAPLLDQTAETGEEYATDELGYAWDMNQTDDVVLNGFNAPQISSGVLSATYTTAGAIVYPLYRTRGETVDASKYTHMSMAFHLEQENRSNVFVRWTKHPEVDELSGYVATGVSGMVDADFAYSGAQIPRRDGLRFYDIDLTGASDSELVQSLVALGAYHTGTWDGSIHGVALQPSNAGPSGTDLGLDWIRLYDPSTSPTITLRWTTRGSATGRDFVRIYLDTDSSGFDGALFRNYVTNDGSFALQTAALPPGDYFAYLEFCYQGQDAIEVLARSDYSGRITLTGGETEKTISLTGPSAQQTFNDSEEFATTVVGNPWDMQHIRDIAFEVNYSQPQLSDGVWSASVLDNGQSAYFMPLFRGYSTDDYSTYPSWYDQGTPYGPRNPIDTSRFNAFSMRMAANQEDRANVALYWTRNERISEFSEQDTGEFTDTGFVSFLDGEAYSRIPRRSASGFRMYSVDLRDGSSFFSERMDDTDVDFHRGGTWSGNVEGFVVQPTTSPGENAEVSIDWIRLYDADSSPTYPIRWSTEGSSSASDFVRVYVDDNAGGNDGDLFVTGLENDGEFDLPVAALPPGEYYVYLQFCHSSVSGVDHLDYSAYSPKFTVRAAPSIQFTSPSFDSGENYSVTLVGDYWDMDDAGDIRKLAELENYGHSAGIFTATTEDTDSDDSQVWLETRKDGKGRIFPIEASRFRYFTFRMKVDPINPETTTMAERIEKGWVTRLIWGINDEILVTGSYSKDIPLLEGWHTYVVDLYEDDLLETRWDDGVAPEERPAQIGWLASEFIGTLRFDPLEVPDPTTFHLDGAMLCAPPKPVDNSFTITWQAGDADGDDESLTLTLEYGAVDQDGTFAATGTIVSDLAIDPGSGFYLWDTTDVTYGEYHLRATIEDADGNTLQRLSSVTVRIDEEGETQPTQYTGVAWGTTTSIPVSGDFDGDGKWDLAVYDPANGKWWAQRIDGTAIHSGEEWTIADAPNALPVSGDYDRDGRWDLALYDPDNPRWAVKSLTMGVLYDNVAFGLTGATPTYGDYDNDGHNDLATYETDLHVWSVGRSSQGPIQRDFGDPATVPVPGDYDGDGNWDFAAYDQNTGKWYIQSYTEVNLVPGVSLGCPIGQPVPGDFNGDGVHDMAVFVPSTATWYIKDVHGNVLLWDFQWGATNGIAVSGDYLRDRSYDLAVFDPSDGAWDVYGVVPTVTEVFTLYSPTGTVNDPQPTFSWSEDRTAQRYQLLVRDSEGREVLSQWVNGMLYAPQNELADGAYTWQVQRWDGSEGTWSDTKEFTIEPGVTDPPDPSPPVSPSGNLEDRTPTFTWTDIGNADQYYLYLERDGVYYFDQWFTGTTYTPETDLPAGSTYEWWVKTYNNNGLGELSDGMTFVLDLDLPAVTTARSPDGTVSSLRPTFTWDSVGNAEKYYLYIERDGAYHSAAWHETTSYTPTADLAPGDYVWRVRTYNADGLGEYSGPAEFTIPADVPGTPVLESPNGSIANTTPTFRWSTVPFAKQYNLIVRNVLNEDVVTEWVAGATTYTPTEALLGGDYTWTVGAWNGNGLGTFADARSFTIEAATGIPAQVTATTPSGTLEDRTPTFEWESTPKATEYTLSILRDGGAYLEPTVSATTYTPETALPGGSTYQWSVRGKNDFGFGPSSDPLTFTLPLHLPGGTTLLSPGESVGNYRPTFRWEAATGAEQYYLYIEKDAAFYQDEWTTQPSFTPTQDLPAGAYTWQVKAYNTDGFGPLSDSMQFTVPDHVPSTPVPQEPWGSIVETKPVFQWTAASFAKQYNIVVRDVFNQDVINQWVTGQTTYTPTEALLGGDYTWAVGAWNEHGLGEYSNALSFSVEADTGIPAQVVLTSPSGEIEDRTPAFQWQTAAKAQSYTLHLTLEGVDYLTETVADTSFTPDTDLLGGRTYAWWVVAANDYGNSLPSETLNVSIGLQLPDATSPIAPSGTVGSFRPTFRWQEVNNADQYRLYIEKDGAFFSDQRLATTSYTPEADLDAGVYIWQVQTLNSDGGGPFSTTMACTVPDDPPGVPILLEPLNATDDTTPAFAWGSAVRATQYNLIVTDVFGNEVLNQWTDATSYTPETELAVAGYAWIVQAWNKYGLGQYSDTSYFAVQTDPELPGQATPTSPAGATDARKPTFEWQAADGATSYTLTLQRGQESVIEETVTATEHTSATNLPGGDYRWWVVAHNQHGAGVASRVLAFTLAAQLPDTTTLVGPSGTATTPRPTFQWETVENADQYYLYIEKDSARFLELWLTETSYTPDTDLAAGEYVWQVRTYNVDGLGEYSDSLTLTVPADPPARPTLLSPTGRGTDTTPTFEWNPVERASQYNLVVRDSLAREVLNVWVDQTSYTPAAPLQLGSYTWVLMAWNAYGLGDYATLDFTLEEEATGPGKVTQLSPTGTITDTTPTLDWEDDPGTQYYYVNIQKDGNFYFDYWTAQSELASWWLWEAGTYSWYVQTWSDGVFGPWSDGMTFTIHIEPPGAATGLAPTGGLELEANPAQFSWNAVEGADWYYLYVQRDGQAYKSHWCDTNTVYDWRLFFDQGQYEWWVQSWGLAGGYGDWSEGASFTVSTPVAPPGRPVPTAPSGAVPGGSVTFSWSGSTHTQWSLINIQKDGTPYFEYWHPLTAQWQPWWTFESGVYTWYAVGWNEILGMGQWSEAGQFTID